MPDPIAAASLFSGSPAWVLLDSFGSFGDRRNHTTATGLTSARHPIKVSFELVAPPGVSGWFVHCPSLKKKRGFNGQPYILNAAGPLVVMRMAFFRPGGSMFDYFVYRAGPGKPSLDLIPGPCPSVGFRKGVGILPSGAGEHYYVVFPVPRLNPRTMFQIQVFSSENQAWSTKVARISVDPETTYDEVVMHHPSKAIASGGSPLAWIDLWRGILLCDQLDKEEPVLRLIKWPVPSPRSDIMDLYAADASRDATLSNGVIRFVEMEFHDEGDAMDIGWTATVWKTTFGSNDWNECFKADIAEILAAHSSSSDLLHNLWDDKSNKLDLNKVSSAPPTLSLTNEEVIYFMANLVSDEAMLLAVNAREKSLEAARQTSSDLPCTPCSFSSFLDAYPGADMAGQSEDIKRVWSLLCSMLCQYGWLETN
uniref:DUF1618 domain-containing protein n=1 Tax=Arundo donax TaxID=35708 RepID=A0A0A9DR90_ARUDO